MEELREKNEAEKELFKKELFNNFQQTGMVNDLKAKMRHDLVNKLKHAKGISLIANNIYINVKKTQKFKIVI